METAGTGTQAWRGQGRDDLVLSLALGLWPGERRRVALGVSLAESLRL
jgi:hypothetical protein